MNSASSCGKWNLAVSESETVFDGNQPRPYRIYNRGPGSITVFDRQNVELATLVAGNCVDFVGDHFTIHADGPEPANGLCEPINLAARQRVTD